ncbi:hypothetical protein OPV22_005544 [Ensete ventricosum]|uniref:Uncharacterized protein n=1 Tax=Ensete ventricosum TaxID=4639 RepID=A0AAV8RRB2_ENSVE|nr:hypothetical protein OPV22_005544 [Ensete ventricosum]
MDPYKHRPWSNFNFPFWITDSGAPVWNNNSSLTIGSRGKLGSRGHYSDDKYDPVRHAERYPVPTCVVNGRREKARAFHM